MAFYFVTKSTGTKETIESMSYILDTFSNLEEVISNWGTAFISREFEEFLKIKGIRHRKVTIAAPWANDTVERVNWFIKSSLTKLLEKASEWRRELGNLQYIINNTYHSVVKIRRSYCWAIPAEPCRLCPAYQAPHGYR